MPRTAKRTSRLTDAQLEEMLALTSTPTASSSS